MLAKTMTTKQQYWLDHIVLNNTTILMYIT